jgi:predicted GNAT superfamily acetyltransferase
MSQSEITIRPCESHADRRLCVDLQRRIWNFSDEDLVSSAMIVVAQHSGGHCYIASHNDQPVGFALAYAGDHNGHRFWHSHMAGVVPEYQDRQVGRALKLHQRDEALRLGIPLIEWTFDPLELRNAHFNIARLGAIVRHYIPDCYGHTTSPLHGGLPTDRLLAEWHIASDRVQQILNGSHAGTATERVEFSARKTKAVQTNLRNNLTDLFSRGYAITGFERGPDHGVYLLERYED